MTEGAEPDVVEQKSEGLGARLRKAGLPARITRHAKGIRMSDDRAAPPEAPILHDGPAEVSRLATLLANQVLEAQMMGRPVPDELIRALLDAASILREYGQELPSLLSQIMHGVDKPET